MPAASRRLAGLTQHLLTRSSAAGERTAAWPSGWPLGQTSDSGITHAVVISGNPLCMEIAEDDSIVWQYRGEGAGTSRPGSRDASKLPNGNYLVTLGDKVVEVAPGETEAVWTYELDTASGNTEFMGAQRLADGSTVVTECGENPRIVEVAADGKTIIAEIPIQPETDNAHQQSRMGKKLADGNYLVPHRVACVKEYDSTGAVVHEFRTDIPELEGTAGLTAYGTGPTNGLATTDDAQARSSFFAERLPDGSTVITCASGNRMCVFDKDRKLAWHVTNADLGGILNDVCGLQVLKSGNFLVSTYGNKTVDGAKMLEISPEKKIVWSYHNPDVTWVHSLQVLSTNGQLEIGRQLEH